MLSLSKVFHLSGSCKDRSVMTRSANL